MGKKSRQKKLNKNAAVLPAAPARPIAPKIIFLRSIAFPLLLGMIVLMGTCLRLYSLNNVQSRSPDEYVYNEQAKTVLDKGIQGIKWMVEQHSIDKNKWLYPPPTRVGYILSLALVMKIGNELDVKAGAYLSSFFSMLSLILVIIFGLRFFNKWATLYALLFMSVSPMELAMARRAWQDAMFGFIGLLLIGISYEITKDFKNRFSQIFFIIIANMCVLVKESGLALFGICVCFIGLSYIVTEKKISKGIMLSFFLSLGVIPSLMALIYASGGLNSLLGVYKHITMGVPYNAYAIQYQSGPWLTYMGGFWILAPLSAFMLLLAVAHILVPRKDTSEDMPEFERNRGTAIGLLLVMAVFFSSTMVIPCLQNFRYISPIYGFFYLVAGLGFWQVISYIKSAADAFWRPIAVSLALLLTVMGAFYDFKNFQRIFIRTDMRDISIGLVKSFNLDIQEVFFEKKAGR